MGSWQRRPADQTFLRPPTPPRRRTSATSCWSDPAGPARPHSSRRSRGARARSAHRHRGDHVRTTTLTAASFTSGAVTLNLLDTPGYPDFVGDLRAGLRAADAAIFVVSGADDIDRPVSLLWRECAAVGMPRAVVVTHLDQPRADFADDHRDVSPHVRRRPGHALARRRRRLGHRRRRSADGRDVARTTRTPGPRSSSPSSRSPRTRPCSTATSRARSIDTESVLTDLRTAIAQGTFFPIVPVSPLTGAGVEELLGIIERAFPDPTVHPLPAVTTPVGRCAQRRRVRPVAAARRRGRAHDDRPLRRSPVTRARLLRHPARRRAGARVRPPRRLRRARGRRATRRTTTTSASARSPRRSSTRTAPRGTAHRR